jgi:predicted hydrocarbon binding protein
MARTKGSAFVALKSFVTRRFGYEGWKRYLGRIEPRERRDIEMPSAKEWYDLNVWVGSLQVLKDVFGEELPEVVFEFGRHEAERDLSTWQRLFLRMANPAYVIEKATEYWRKFCDFGRWEVERKGNNAAVATLTGVPVADALYCEELTGYLKHLFELVGAKNVKVEHSRCRSRGDDDCVWNGSWD